MNHILSNKYPAEEEKQMRAEMTVAVCHATLRDGIAGISGLIEDDLTVWSLQKTAMESQ